MRVDPLDDFAVELEDQAQHAMRGGMLRAEIDRVFARLLRVAGADPGGADADVEGADVAHLASPPGLRLALGLCSLAWILQQLVRGLGAVGFASLGLAVGSAGLPPPVWAGCRWSWACWPGS